MPKIVLWACAIAFALSTVVVLAQDTPPMPPHVTTG